MIIETSDNRLFRVWPLPEPGLDHVWGGIEMKRAKGGAFVEKANAKATLVRKAATKIIRED